MEKMKRGLSKSIQQRWRVSLSKMEPYEAHVAICSPCTLTWCHGVGKDRWKGGMEISGSLVSCFDIPLFACPPEAGRTTKQEMLHMFLTEDACGNVCTSSSREGSSGHMAQIGLITHWC